MATNQALKVLNRIKPVKRVVKEWEGEKFEFREPTLAQSLKMSSEPSHLERVWIFLVDSCYVPGTDTKVFEPAHKDQIFSMGSYEENTIIEVAQKAMEEMKTKVPTAKVEITEMEVEKSEQQSITP